MEYRSLGVTGLKVSAISYGNWVNSDDKETEKINTILIKKAWELGINYFDTSETYGSGKAEIHLGKALKSLNVQRQDFDQEFPNSKFLSRKHIIEGLKNSLKRLNIPYVDIVFAHQFECETPMEEICRAFDWVIRHGLALYWGTCEWSAQQIHQALGVCKRLNLQKPVVEQPQYNMMVRQRFEWEYENLFSAGFGATVWSPLCSELLTGQYNDNIEIYGRFSPEKKKEVQSQLKSLEKIAKELGITQTQLSLAWVLKNKDVNTVITAVIKPEQLEENVKSVQFIKLITPEIEERIEKILTNKPTTQFNSKSFKPFNTRRDLYV